jgi:tetratricopeptide (TPR) repeat protein
MRGRRGDCQSSVATSARRSKVPIRSRLSTPPDNRQNAATVTRTPNAIATTPPGPSVWDRFHPGATAAQPAAPPTPALNRFAEAMFALGAQSFLAGRPEETETLLRLSIGAGGNDFAALGVLGLMAVERKDFAAAEGWLRAALAINPDEPTTLNNLGEVLRRTDRFDDAMPCYQRAVALAPDYAEAYDNHGCALTQAGRPAEALPYHQRAIALKHDFALAHDRLRGALVDLNRHEEALSDLRHAAAWESDLAKLRLNEAYVLLALGRFSLGWEAYEARWDMLVDGLPIARRHAEHPRWNGQTTLAGRTLLLHAEQGLGDTLQFVRYAPKLARQGALVIVEAQPSLVPLLRTLDGVMQVVATDVAPPAFDLQCPLLSLPLVCGTTLATIPGEVPYLTPPPERITSWRHRLGRPRAGHRHTVHRRIGLAWSGNPNYPNDHTRSIPIRRLEPLLVRTDCELHLVQTSIPAAERAVLEGLPSVKDHSSALADFADTAALLSLMDLVICVDTAVAHLAGALARPTWLLLPFSAEWRWLTVRADCPWYPTMRLFRQPAPGDWDAVLAAVARALDA